jgi:hypothetical protein
MDNRQLRVFALGIKNRFFEAANLDTADFPGFSRFIADLLLDRLLSLPVLKSDQTPTSGE